MGCLHADVKIVNNNWRDNVSVKLIVSSGSDFDARIDYQKALSLACACNCNVPIFVKIDNFCGQFIPAPYLEIEPDVLWVYPSFDVENYVCSNTDWLIN